MESTFFEHIYAHKWNYLIVASVFAFRSMFKWFLQRWALRLEYETKNLTYAPQFYTRNFKFEFRAIPGNTGVQEATDIIMSDLATKQFWSLLRAHRALKKEQKRRLNQTRTSKDNA